MNISYDHNNIFAKILRGEIPCYSVFEDKNTIAFMDIMPQSVGHTLVVPKTASRNILDADPFVLSDLIVVVQKISKAAKLAFQANGITVMQFNESTAGQTVFHLHFHVIPRYEGTPLHIHSHQSTDHKVLAENAEKLKATLAL